ncbi:MAG: SMP-30/gluconolactonase/LRE family protein [Candidatus Poribacteria bacterium]
MLSAICFALLIGGMAMDKDSGLDAIMEPNSLQQIAKDLKFTEGPVWCPEGYLLFSDIPADTIYKWTPDGKLEKFRSPSGNSNGLTLDRQGRLIACEHGNRRVSRTELDGTIKILAEKYNGKRLNSPNDVVVKSDGSIYFTDPPYGVEQAKRELDIQGVYRISPDGVLTLLVNDFEKPNGLAFSPDEKVLYVGDTDRKHVRAFDVKPDGTLANGRIFADLSAEKQNGPDGMKVDEKGNLYVTSGVVWGFDKAGKHLGDIVTPEPPANCAFGGKDNKTLFITARTSVYKVQLKVKGIVPIVSKAKD